MTTSVRAGDIVRVADLGGTLLFAIEGALTGLAAGLDPIGVLVLAFVTALGGGVIRDLLIGAVPPAAVAGRSYALVVLAAAILTWMFHVAIAAVPATLLVALDAAGLALFAVAGTEKALDRGIDAVVAMFLGTVGAVGGGLLRDVLINQVPRVLRVDIYASAALLAAAIVVIGRRFGWPPRGVAVIAGLSCFAVRMLAYAYGWHLPTAIS
jgi:uncharacterized membrane protein YeiH